MKFKVIGVTNKPEWDKKEKACLADCIREAIHIFGKDGREPNANDRCKMRLIFNPNLETKIRQWLGLSHFPMDRIWGIEFKFYDLYDDFTGEILLRDEMRE